VIELQTMEMNIVALLENGELYGWVKIIFKQKTNK